MAESVLGYENVAPIKHNCAKNWQLGLQFGPKLDKTHQNEELVFYFSQ